MTVNPAGGSGDAQGRDGWCTPEWLAELIGEVDWDPCSNRRSHIQANCACDLRDGDDGLTWDREGPWAVFWCGGGEIIRPPDRVFINPPYSRGQVQLWVDKYRHTCFIFLLRWDPSTKWFAELLPHCTHVWFPNRRINFEPPPGVPSSSNPFPHALYLRDPDPALVDRLQGAGYLLPVDKGTREAHPGPHDEQTHPPCTTCRSTRSGAGGGQATIGRSPPYHPLNDVGPTWKITCPTPGTCAAKGCGDHEGCRLAGRGLGSEGAR